MLRGAQPIQLFAIPYHLHAFICANNLMLPNKLSTARNTHAVYQPASTFSSCPCQRLSNGRLGSFIQNKQLVATTAAMADTAATHDGYNHTIRISEVGDSVVMMWCVQLQLQAHGCAVQRTCTTRKKQHMNMCNHAPAPTTGTKIWLAARYGHRHDSLLVPQYAPCRCRISAQVPNAAPLGSLGAQALCAVLWGSVVA